MDCNNTVRSYIESCSSVELQAVVPAGPPPYTLGNFYHAALSTSIQSLE